MASASGARALNGSTVDLRCRQCGYQAVVRGKPPICPMCRGFAWEPARTRPSSQPEPEPHVGPARPAKASPRWTDVEVLLARLDATGSTFPSATSVHNRVTRYASGWRLMLETDIGSSWVNIASIRGCWETFERLGRIRRRDVLEPGRCSAFMMALFAQVAGVVDEAGDGASLALPHPSRR